MGRLRPLHPIADLPERGCVRSTSRSTLTNPEAPGEFQQTSLTKLLRLVFDPAARHFDHWPECEVTLASVRI
jgi:hypothetical protein